MSKRLIAGIIGVAVSAWLLSGVSASLAAARLGPPNAEGLPVNVGGVPLHSSGVGIYTDRDGLFLAPLHVAGHCTHALVARPDGFKPAERLYTDGERDLVLLRTDKSEASAALRLAGREGSAAPRAVVRYDHLKGLASRSVLEATMFSARAGRYGLSVRASQPIVGGNSGSPVILTDGTVGGLIASVAKEDPRLAFAIPTASLVVFLRDAGHEPDFVNAERADAPKAGPETFTFPVLCYKPPTPEEGDAD